MLNLIDNPKISKNQKICTIKFLVTWAFGGLVWICKWMNVRGFKDWLQQSTNEMNERWKELSNARCRNNKWITQRKNLTHPWLQIIFHVWDCAKQSLKPVLIFTVYILPKNTMGPWREVVVDPQNQIFITKTLP